MRFVTLKFLISFILWQFHNFIYIHIMHFSFSFLLSSHPPPTLVCGVCIYVCVVCVFLHVSALRTILVNQVPVLASALFEPGSGGVFSADPRPGVHCDLPLQSHSGNMEFQSRLPHPSLCGFWGQTQVFKLGWWVFSPMGNTSPNVWNFNKNKV